jgi:hypothetical protein
MNRFNLWVGAILLSCTTQSFATNTAYYYLLHHEALQKAMAQCPKFSPKNISCDELKNISLRANALAYELREDPQAFGNKILKLQQDASTTENKVQLAERLAIVKWLESPEG